MKKTMTKAKRIFEDTYTEARIHVKRYPDEDYNVVGFNGMICKDDECIYTRTANEIRKYIESERKWLKIGRELGENLEYIEIKEAALKMVENTLANQYIID